MVEVEEAAWVGLRPEVLLVEGVAGMVRVLAPLREPLAVVLLEAEAQTDTETEEFRVRDTVPVALRDLRLLLLRLWLALPE